LENWHQRGEANEILEKHTSRKAERGRQFEIQTGKNNWAVKIGRRSQYTEEEKTNEMGKVVCAGNRKKTAKKGVYTSKTGRLRKSIKTGPKTSGGKRGNPAKKDQMCGSILNKEGGKIRQKQKKDNQQKKTRKKERRQSAARWSKNRNAGASNEAIFEPKKWDRRAQKSKEDIEKQSSFSRVNERRQSERFGWWVGGGGGRRGLSGSATTMAKPSKAKGKNKVNNG